MADKKEKSMMYGRNMDRRQRMDEGYSGMIEADYSAPANLPQEKKVKFYKKPPYLSQDIDDTVQEVDRTAEKNVRKLEERASKSRY